MQHGGAITSRPASLDNDTTVAPSTSLNTRAINTVFQISTTRTAFVAYTLQINTSAAIALAQSGTCLLQIADDAAFTQNVTTLCTRPFSINSVLGLSGTTTITVFGYIPANKYVKVSTVSMVGNPTVTLQSNAPETLL